ITNFHDPGFALEYRSQITGKGREELRRCSYDNVRSDEQAGQKARNAETQIIKYPPGHTSIWGDVGPHTDHFDAVDVFFLIQLVFVAFKHLPFWKIGKAGDDGDLRALLHPFAAMLVRT